MRASVQRCDPGRFGFAGAAVEKAGAECYVQAPLPPVRRIYIRRDVIEPGVYEVKRSPSLYGWAHATVEKRVRVRRGTAGWIDYPRLAWRTGASCSGRTRTTRISSGPPSPCPASISRLPRRLALGSRGSRAGLLGVAADMGYGRLAFSRGLRRTWRSR